MFAEETLGKLPPFVAHYDVWLLIVAIIAGGFYVSRVLQPLMVEQGKAAITRSQRLWFAGAVLVLFVASDYPMHDIAEDYLYSVHMIQHLLLTFVFPPMMLKACPEWLGRLILGEGHIEKWAGRLTRPFIAAVVYNVLTALTHSAFVVNTSADVPIFHYLVHLTIVISAFMVWVAIVGPIPELRIGYVGQAFHLFLLSVIPTIPAAFLTVSEVALYRSYDQSERLWGLSAINDQQLAGVVMKVVGGLYLWMLILVIFTNGVRESDRASGGASKFRGRLATQDEIDARDAARGASDSDGSAENSSVSDSEVSSEGIVGSDATHPTPHLR